MIKKIYIYRLQIASKCISINTLILTENHCVIQLMNKKKIIQAVPLSNIEHSLFYQREPKKRSLTSNR